MLCERPSYAADDSHLPAFHTGKAPEPLGLAPFEKILPAVVKVPSISTHYRKTIRQYDLQCKTVRELELMEAESEELKKASVKAFNEKLRSTILCKNPESDPEELSSIWKAASIQKTLAAKKADTTRSPPPPRAPPKQVVNDEALDEDIESFVNQVYQEASEALASTAAEALNQKDEVDEASTTKKDVKVQEDQNVGRSKNDDPAYHPQGIKPKKSPLKGRPAWALSEDQAEALDEEEEEELLGFIDGLDFDEFLTKLEDANLQEAFKTLQENESKQQGGDEKAWRKSFVNALNRAAYKRVPTGASGAVDGAESIADTNMSKVSHTSRMRTEATLQKIQAVKGEGGEGEASAAGEWDSRTNAGEERSVSAVQRGLKDAEEFLLSHPELKTVHSTASVRAMIQKLEHHMRTNPHLPN